MYPIEAILIPDPQQELRTKICPYCGGVTYPPSFYCVKCRRLEI